MRGTFKAALAVSAFAVVAAAHAVTFATYAYSAPAYTLTAFGGGTTDFDGNAAVYAQVGGLNFVTDEVSLSAGAPAGGGFATTGTVKLTSANGSTLLGDFDGTAYDGGSPFASFAGNVAFTGGTGDFAGWIGAGTASGSFLLPGVGTVGDTYDGSLNIGGTAAAVPEPASMATLGLGIAALIRRRRKSA